ncbi:heparinase II/III family protein [Paenibacillus sp. GYB004]|uniref:OmpL47-type beta-barrel domain-containing protein n=1 Tax=Paenibacillus sp. GYB004 TaxID=2994393 RepID=UPI002F9645EA
MKRFIRRSVLRTVALVMAAVLVSGAVPFVPGQTVTAEEIAVLEPEAGMETQVEVGAEAEPQPDPEVEAEAVTGIEAEVEAITMEEAGDMMSIQQAPELPNGGFEEIAAGRPAGWSYISGGVESSTAQVRGGAYSVKLTDTSSASSTGLRSAKMPATAGQTYEASVYSYNLEGVSQLYLEYWDASNNYTQIYIGSNSSLNGWGRIQVSGVAPAGTVAVSLRLYLHVANIGSAYFDDASFSQVLTGPQPGLLNGGLEEVDNGRPKYWEMAATAQLSTEQKRSGTYSVKINDPTSTAGVTVRSHRIAVTAGQRYESTVWSYNLQGVSQLYLEFWDANNNYTTILTGTNDTLNAWKQIRVEGLAPEGTTQAAVRFYLHSANIGTAYFDDAAFRESPAVPVPQLQNGSFEQVAQNKPVGWKGLNGDVQLSGDQTKDGVNSAKIAYSGSGAVPGVRSHPVAVTPGERYDGTIHVYTTSGVPALHLDYWDADETLLASAAAEGTGAGTWEPLTAGGIAPAGAKSVTLRLTMNASQAGEAYFDDALLRRADTTVNAKTRTTYYTPAKVAAARSNVQQYNWAAILKDGAVARADKYLVKGLDFIWNIVTGPNLPRSYGVNQTIGSPITGREIDKFGNYPYKADPINDPWKIVDPSSGYKFPTNDFGAYYESGLDDHGVFQPNLADRSLLVNTLYPEKGPDWGVDDGFGWVDENGHRYTFIAYYNHWFVWYGSGMIQDAMQGLRDAYLYTGDAKYARAGSVLLDRVADVYPEMDTMKHDKTVFLNSHGGTGLGYAVGSIWETGLVKDFISAYDAFFPAMNDTQLTSFLEGKRNLYKLINSKSTGAGIKRNIEDGILREVFPGVKAARIRGNDGMHQSALAMAAVVYDTLPQTKEWLDFTFQSGGNVSSPPGVSGGNILNSLISVVDRDGNGNEASPGYNMLWLSTHQLTADILEGYDLYPEADLYENVKFRKMFSAFYPLILSEKYTANIGDTGSTGNPSISVKLTDMVKAFYKFGDPVYAQMAYFLNNNRADGIHLDVFSANPNAIAEQIRSVIAQHGPLNLGSDNLTGYGFAALRDGANVFNSFGLSYAFPSMDIAYQNTDVKLFEASGTVQLEANNPGADITFEFTVTKADDYEIDLLPFKAPTYGIYRISLDGQPMMDMDFYGSNSNDFIALGRKQLSVGTHQIRFENIGKNAASGNYKMGVRNLNLLDETARQQRDQAGVQANTLRDFWMYYGRNTGHGHRDTLNLGVHAFGLDLSPDLGYPEFADSIDMHRAQWVVNTISHNTVVVDKKKQSPQFIAEPKHFDDGGMVKLIDVEAPKVYTQTDLYKRTTAMIKIDDANSYAVDFFRVKGGSDHYFSFHGAEGTATAEGLQLVQQPTGTYAGPNVEYGQRVDDVAGSGYMGSGFHYLKNVSRDTSPADTFSIDWKVVDTWKVLPAPADIHLRLTMLGQVDDVALADGVPPQNKPGNPKALRYMVAHRNGTNLDSLFTSVIEPYKDSRTIASIVPAAVKAGGQPVSGNDVKAVKVTLANGRVDYIVSALNTAVEYTIDDKLRFKGFMGVYSEQNGQEVYRYVHDGSYMALVGENAPDAAGALQGTVVTFTKTPSVQNEIIVEMDLTGATLEQLTGKTIYVANDGVRNAAYRIQGAVSLGSGQYKLDIGDITPIRSFADAYDFSKGYIYDMAEGAAFRIPLTRALYQVQTVAAVTGKQQQGWYTSEATVSLSVYGMAGSVSSSVYSLDGGTSWQTYHTPFALSDSGTHVVQFRSTDAVGNDEPVQSVTVPVDRLAPVTQAQTSAEAGAGGWYASPVSVALTASDAHSGIAGTEYALSVTGSTYGPQGGFQPYTGPIVLQDGSHVLQFRSVDLAGNTEQLQTVEVKVVTLEGMSAKVDSYADSGHIQATFASQLSYRLSVIKLLVSQGSVQTAIDYMNDFLAYIRDPSVQQQGLLSGRALGDLVSSAQHWIHGN